MKSGKRSASAARQLRMALVSYLNTYPIVWGLKHHADQPKPEIILCPPSQGTQALLSETVDMALVPSVTYLNANRSFELLPFGIVVHEKIDTVLLVGNQPMEKWKRVFMDEDSLTSIQLAKIVFHIKKLAPQCVSGIRDIDKLDGDSGALIIGDKCFTLASRFSHVYDLAQLWFELTGLPFVFALFLVNPKLDLEKRAQAYRLLKASVELGLNNLPLVITSWCEENPKERNQKDQAYYYDYLKNKISYYLTDEALAGLREFFKKCETPLAPDKEGRLTRQYFHAFNG